MAENAQEDFLGREPLSFSLEDASRLLPHAELEKPTSKAAAKFSAAHLGAEVLKHLSHCSSENLLFGEAQIPQPIANELLAIIVDVKLNATDRLVGVATDGCGLL